MFFILVIQSYVVAWLMFDIRREVHVYVCVCYTVDREIFVIKQLMGVISHEN